MDKCYSKPLRQLTETVNLNAGSEKSAFGGTDSRVATGNSCAVVLTNVMFV